MVELRPWKWRKKSKDDLTSIKTITEDKQPHFKEIYDYSYVEKHKITRQNQEPIPGYKPVNGNGDEIEVGIIVSGDSTPEGSLTLIINNPANNTKLPKGTDEKLKAHAEDGSGTYNYHVKIWKKGGPPPLTPIKHSNIVGAMPEEDLSSLEPGKYEIIITVEDSTNISLTKEERINITIKPGVVDDKDVKLTIDNPSDGAKLPKGTDEKIQAHTEGGSGTYDYHVNIIGTADGKEAIPEIREQGKTGSLEPVALDSLDVGGYSVGITVQDTNDKSKSETKSIMIYIEEPKKGGKKHKIKLEMDAGTLTLTNDTKIKVSTTSSGQPPYEKGLFEYYNSVQVGLYGGPKDTGLEEEEEKEVKVELVNPGDFVFETYDMEGEKGSNVTEFICTVKESMPEEIVIKVKLQKKKTESLNVNITSLTNGLHFPLKKIPNLEAEVTGGTPNYTIKAKVVDVTDPTNKEDTYSHSETGPSGKMEPFNLSNLPAGKYEITVSAEDSSTPKAAGSKTITIYVDSSNKSRWMYLRAIEASKAEVIPELKIKNIAIKEAGAERTVGDRETATDGKLKGMIVERILFGVSVELVEEKLEIEDPSWRIKEIKCHPSNPIGHDEKRFVVDVYLEKKPIDATNFEVILKDQRGFKPGLAEEVIIYIKQGSSTPIHLRMKTDQHGVARKEISLRETTQFITKELRCISFFDKIDYEILEVNQISPEEKKAKKGELFILDPEKKDYKFEVVVRRKYLELAAIDSKGKSIPNLEIGGFSVRDSNSQGYGGHSRTEKDGIIYLGPLSLVNESVLYTEHLYSEDPWKIAFVTQTAPRGGPQKKIPGKDVICKSSGKDKEFKVDLILIKDTARPKRILWIRVQDGPSKKANLVPDFVLEDVEVEENKKVTNIGTLKTGSENAGQLKGMAKAYIAEGYVKLNTEKIKSGSPKWKIVACYPTTKNPIGPKDKYMESIVVVNSIKISGRIINGDATAANKVPLDSTGEYLNDIWHKEVVPINAKECTIKLFQGNQEVKDIIVNPEVDGTFTISKVPSAMNYYVHVTYEGKNYMHYVNKDNVRYQRGGNNQPDNSAPPAPINTDKNPKHINVVVDVNGPSSESELVIGLEKAKHNLNWEELDTNRKIIIQSKETGKEIGSKSIKDIIGSDNKWSLSKKGVVTKVSNEQAGLGSSKDVTSSINSSDNKWSISLDRSVIGHTWVVSLDRDDEDTKLENAELDSKHLGINSQKKVEITLAPGNNDMLLYLGKSSTYKFDTKFKSGKTTYTPLKELSKGSGGVWATFPVRIKNKEQRQLSLGFDTKDVRCVPNNLFPHIIKMPLDRVITSIDAWDSWVVALKVKDPKFGKINSNQLRHNNFDLSVTEIPPNKVIDLEICVFLPHNLILHRGSVVPTFTFYFTPLDMEGHPVTQYSQEIEIKAEKIVSDLDEVQPTQDGELLPSKNFLKKSKIIGHKNVTYDFDEDIIPDLKRLSFSLKGLEPDIEFIKTITSPSGRTNQRWALASHLSALKQKLNIKGRFKAVNKRLNKIKEYLLEDKKMVYLKEHADPVAKLLLEQRYIEILKTKGYNDFKTPLNKEIESIVNLINLIDSNYIKFEEDIKTINAETEGNLAHEIITIFEQLHVIEESIFQLSVDLKVILNISQ